MMASYLSVPSSAGVTDFRSSPLSIAAAVLEISSIRVCIREMIDALDCFTSR